MDSLQYRARADVACAEGFAGLTADRNTVELLDHLAAADEATRRRLLPTILRGFFQDGFTRGTLFAARVIEEASR